MNLETTNFTRPSKLVANLIMLSQDTTCVILPEILSIYTTGCCINPFMLTFRKYMFVYVWAWPRLLLVGVRFSIISFIALAYLRCSTSPPEAFSMQSGWANFSEDWHAQRLWTTGALSIYHLHRRYARSRRLYFTNTAAVHSWSISGYSVYWHPNIQYIATCFAAACILFGTSDHVRTNTMIYIIV